MTRLAYQNIEQATDLTMTVDGKPLLIACRQLETLLVFEELRQLEINNLPLLLVFFVRILRCRKSYVASHTPYLRLEDKQKSCTIEGNLFIARCLNSAESSYYIGGLPHA